MANWISRPGVVDCSPHPLKYEVVDWEESVGLAMFAEIERAAREKEGDSSKPAMRHFRPPTKSNAGKLDSST